VESSIVFLLRPRRPGEAVEVWHVTPVDGGNARVVVEHDDAVHFARTVPAIPFTAPLARLARMVEEEGARLSSPPKEIAKRLRQMIREPVS